MHSSVWCAGIAGQCRSQALCPAAAAATVCCSRVHVSQQPAPPRLPLPCRFPSPVVFNAADPSHAAFVQAAAILKAQVGLGMAWWYTGLRTQPVTCCSQVHRPQPLDKAARPQVRRSMLSICLPVATPGLPLPFLSTQVYGLPVPDWASDANRVVKVRAWCCSGACCCCSSSIGAAGSPSADQLASRLLQVCNRACMLNCQPPASVSVGVHLLQVAAEVEVEPFVPKENVKIETGGRSC